jgi:hypothetical protein
VGGEEHITPEKFYLHAECISRGNIKAEEEGKHARLR